MTSEAKPVMSIYFKGIVFIQKALITQAYFIDKNVSKVKAYKILFNVGRFKVVDEFPVMRSLRSGEIEEGFGSILVNYFFNRRSVDVVGPAPVLQLENYFSFLYS